MKKSEALPRERQSQGVGRGCYVTEGKKSVSPVPDKQTTEESGEAASKWPRPGFSRCGREEDDQEDA